MTPISSLLCLISYLHLCSTQLPFFAFLFYMYLFRPTKIVWIVATYQPYLKQNILKFMDVFQNKIFNQPT